MPWPLMAIIILKKQLSLWLTKTQQTQQHLTQRRQLQAPRLVLDGLGKAPRTTRPMMRTAVEVAMSVEVYYLSSTAKKESNNSKIVHAHLTGNRGNVDRLESGQEGRAKETLQVQLKSRRHQQQMEKAADASKAQALIEEQLNQLICRLAEQKYTMVTANMFDGDFLRLVPNLRILPANANTVALQTIIRDR